jgi:hypothetical protein
LRQIIGACDHHEGNRHRRAAIVALEIGHPGDKRHGGGNSVGQCAGDRESHQSTAGHAGHVDPRGIGDLARHEIVDQ